MHATKPALVCAGPPSSARWTRAMLICRRESERLQRRAGPRVSNSPCRPLSDRSARRDLSDLRLGSPTRLTALFQAPCLLLLHPDASAQRHARLVGQSLRRLVLQAASPIWKKRDATRRGFVRPTLPPASDDMTQWLQWPPRNGLHDLHFCEQNPIAYKLDSQEPCSYVTP